MRVPDAFAAATTPRAVAMSEAIGFSIRIGKPASIAANAAGACW
jgi:hypothetical protein